MQFLLSGCRCHPPASKYAYVFYLGSFAVVVSKVLCPASMFVVLFVFVRSRMLCFSSLRCEIAELYTCFGR